MLGGVRYVLNRGGEEIRGGKSTLHQNIQESRGRRRNHSYIVLEPIKGALFRHLYFWNASLTPFQYKMRSHTLLISIRNDC